MVTAELHKGWPSWSAIQNITGRIVRASKDDDNNRIAKAIKSFFVKGKYGLPEKLPCLMKSWLDYEDKEDKNLG